MEKLKVGIIGCGVISNIYLENCRSFPILEVAAVADIDLDRAKAKADEFGIPKACSVAELLSDPEIKIVINLTIPKVHAEVALQALEAGKHVYGEKPLAVSLEDGQKVLKRAKELDLRVGSAPDTVLGGGIQTCRKLIEDGWIGKPIAVTAFMMSHGPESWHPDPEFFYAPGGGPMFDMGPYYLTTLINLIGSVRRVTGSAQPSFPERTITSEKKYGTKIPVEVATHVAGVLDFTSGAVGTIVTSFDVWSAEVPRIEIYGTHGTLSVPDPNTFGGPVRIRRQGATEWSEIPLTHGFTENSRGLGVADMAFAILNNRPHRANGDVAYHVLEIMHGVHIASETGQHYTMKSECDRPAPLPTGFSQNVMATVGLD